MRFINLVGLTVAAIISGSAADECNDFCIARLGKNAGCGSYCKGKDVCQALHWKTESTICIHGAKVSGFGCDGLRDLRVVSCTEARTLASGEAAAPATTTSSPDVIPPPPKGKPAKKATPEVRPPSGLVGSDGRRYTILSKLGKGAQGDVVLARREPDGMEVAIKRCSKAQEHEIEALMAVQGVSGFNQLIDRFSSAETTYLVLSRLGSAISDLKKNYGSFSPEAAGSIIIQMIDRMEALHSAGYVHLDLFPNNVVVGVGAESNQLFLIDFGQARRIRAGDEKGRRFDAMSISHSVLRLLAPSSKYGSPQHIGSTPLETVCAGLPRAVLEMFRYTHQTLRRDESPDYDLLRSLARQLVPRYNGSLIL
jgi:hypothetical protein